MDPTQLLEHITATAERLNPTRLRATLRAYTRGGYPSTSIPAGVNGTSDHPTPTWDAADRQHRAMARRYARALTDAANALHQAEQIERAVIPPTPGDARYQDWRQACAQAAAEEVSPQAVECENAQCRRVVARTAADPVRHGRCTACAAYYERTGRERQPRD